MYNYNGLLKVNIFFLLSTSLPLCIAVPNEYFLLLFGTFCLKALSDSQLYAHVSNSQLKHGADPRAQKYFYI